MSCQFSPAGLRTACLGSRDHRCQPSRYARHIQSRRPRPQRHYHLKQSSMTQSVQTFHRSRCIAPMRKTQNVQADAFVEIQHLSRNCRLWEFGLHVLNTNITMHSSCLLNCQSRRPAVLQHTHHFFDAWISRSTSCLE